MGTFVSDHHDDVRYFLYLLLDKARKIHKNTYESVLWAVLNIFVLKRIFNFKSNQIIVFHVEAD